MTDIELFTKEYLSRIFYFCLKKTGSEQDAADLAGEISFEILKVLSSGESPREFSAWVWAVARNRWARWSKRRYYRFPENEDIADYAEELTSEDDVESSVIRAEELALIRRELAFIRTDYRQILVAHYFEEMSVSQISKRFGIPLGTVKTKLQSSRRQVKEGMNMARQFGTRSFQPETIGFIASGLQPNGLPWSAIQRKIPVNILCAANNNPCTLEELSMELGIAMPYMEEEVSLLEKSELIRRLDHDRFLTAFFISPKECKNEINELSCRFAERNYRALWELAGEACRIAEPLGAADGAVSPADRQMYFAFFTEQMLQLDSLPANIYGCFKRSDGGTWGLIGFEQGSVCRLANPFFNNNGCWAQSHLGWDGFQASGEDYGKRACTQQLPDHYNLQYLRMAALGYDPDRFTREERLAVDTLLSQGFCVRTEDGRLRVAAILFADDSREQLTEKLRKLPSYQALLSATQAYIDEAKAIVARYSNPILSEDFDYYVAMSLTSRGLFAQLWKDSGLYTGGLCEFSAFYYRTDEA